MTQTYVYKIISWGNQSSGFWQPSDVAHRLLRVQAERPAQLWLPQHRGQFVFPRFQTTLLHHPLLSTLVNLGWHQPGFLRSDLRLIHNLQHHGRGQDQVGQAHSIRSFLSMANSSNRFHPLTRGCLLDRDVHFYLLDPDRYRYSYENCRTETMLTSVKDECQCQRGVGMLKHE